MYYYPDEKYKSPKKLSCCSCIIIVFVYMFKKTNNSFVKIVRYFIHFLTSYLYLNGFTLFNPTKINMINVIQI